ncbi:hypothetical protein ACHAQH_006349 [Verticillium albo-atrum]
MELLIKPKPTALPALRAKGWGSNDANRKWQFWKQPEAETSALDPRQQPEHEEKVKQAHASVHETRVILYNYLIHSVAKMKIAASAYTGNYNQWTIKDEPSLDEVVGFWRVEIISEAMKTDNNSWQRNLDTFFDTLHLNFEILLTTGCSMHIHISPGLDVNLRYTKDQITCILKAIAFYDQAITKIMPADRKNNEFALSNFQAPRTNQMLKDGHANVSSASWAPLFSQFDKISFIGAVHTGSFRRDRFMSWNFGNLTDSCGTVEFRRPPGVDSAAKAKHWAGFALAFVANALITDWDNSELREYKGHGTVADLQKYSKKANRCSRRHRALPSC